ncbi:MAG: polyprenyl synthetase family protein [Tissierellia bacterium]|mgnify:CR=1 FL=1|nr:polyprenyl synthetase family protein [Tissierellia bacterium]
MLLEDVVGEVRKVVDQELKELLKEKAYYQDKIFESINYSLFTGGKRIRPILLLKSCEAFSGDYKQALPFALAIEMIHTYSLIHDDLPSMDDDDFRRDKPTNHKVFGEAISILAGDGLLNLAFETMVSFTLKNSNTIEEYNRNIRAIDEIGRYSGIYGMIGGQVIDLLSNDISMDEDKLLFMYKCKTAALIQASVVAGAILGGGTDEEIENMRQFGLYLGLAYQIRDDILDEKEDRKINKVTYLRYNNIVEAETKVDKLSKKAIEILSFYKGKDVDFLKKLAKELTGRKF